MSVGLARRMGRAKRGSRAPESVRNDMILRTFCQVQVHEEILKTIVQALSERGILGELRSESGIILPDRGRVEIK